jgi:hypothetical protein
MSRRHTPTALSSDAKFAWCSTRDAAGKGKFMDVDYLAVATAMPAAIRSATAIMEGL